jgi:hypothetical protein
MAKFESKYKNIIDLLMMTNKSYLLSNMNKLLSDAWNDDPNLFLKSLCFIRDPRNGLGKKEISYYMLQFLKDNFQKTYNNNIKKIVVEYGCIKDLLLMSKYKIQEKSKNTELEIFAEILKSDLSKDKPSLAVKWAPRERTRYHELANVISKILFPDAKNSTELYRKQILVPLNKKIITVEQQMCSNNWNKINYNDVPLGAIKKYGKISISDKNKYLSDSASSTVSTYLTMPGAFMRHDKERFLAYCESKKYGSRINKKNSFESLFIENAIYGLDSNMENKIMSLLNQYDVCVDESDFEQIKYDLINENMFEEFEDDFEDEDQLNVADFSVAKELTCYNFDDKKCESENSDNSEWDIM